MKIGPNGGFPDGEVTHPADGLSTYFSGFRKFSITQISLEAPLTAW
jgi:hypothetical protein